MKLSILITGGQATGKTTLADSIVSEYPADTGITVVYERKEKSTTLSDKIFYTARRDMIIQTHRVVNFIRISFSSISQADYELLCTLAKYKELKYKMPGYANIELPFQLLVVEYQIPSAKFNPADFPFFDQVIILNRLPQFAENQSEKIQAVPQ